MKKFKLKYKYKLKNKILINCFNRNFDDTRKIYNKETQKYNIEI